MTSGSGACPPGSADHAEIPSSGPSSSHDVAIVGAGAAGLAAAAVLRGVGLHCILIEAGGHIGGRAHTVTPDCLGGARFDTGATWLHQTDRNPLVRLAERHGVPLVPAHEGPRRLFVGDRPATAEEVQDYEAAHDAWERTARRRAEGADIALSEAAGPPGPWTASIENWEGAIIAAADADVLGLHDWHRNRLDEGDLSPPGGVGALLAALLGPIAGPVRFDTEVEAIEWGGDGCRLRVAGGPTVRARAVIVTVSTGVLRAGRIAFEPALPAATRAAIDGLPMGLLSKLALPATGADRLGLDPETLLEHRLEARGRGGMLLSAWPSGLPYVAGFFGGRHARALAGRPAAALAEARAMLCRLLGPDAAGAVDAEAGAETGFVTRWAEDPRFRGAYAYCPPGRSHSRALLSEPVGDGRLLFAGEACRADGLAGTVGGALADGERAAKLLLCRRFGMESAPGLLDGFPYAPRPV